MKIIIAIIGMAALFSADSAMAQTMERGREKERPAGRFAQQNERQEARLSRGDIGEHREVMASLRSEYRKAVHRIQNLKASADSTDEQILRAVEQSVRIYAEIQRTRAQHYLRIRERAGNERAARMAGRFMDPGERELMRVRPERREVRDDTNRQRRDRSERSLREDRRSRTPSYGRE